MDPIAASNNFSVKWQIAAISSMCYYTSIGLGSGLELHWRQDPCQTFHDALLEMHVGPVLAVVCFHKPIIEKYE